MAQAETNSDEVNMETLIEKAEPLDLSMNDIDTEYVQMTTASSAKSKFSFLVNNIQSPEDLEFLQTQKTRKAWKRRITDLDGDGIEDNEKFSHDELDEFYDPLVFGVAEDLHNTHHGNLPGHKQMEFTLNQGEPPIHWQEIVHKGWATSF